MNDKALTKERGIDSAISCAKVGDVRGARIAIGLSGNITDDEVIDALIELEKAFDLFRNQKHIEAHQYFQKTLPLLEASDDEEAKHMISTLSRFAEGLSALFSGNAHLATELLNVSSDAIEKISFFFPEFKIASFSYKAASLIALSRTYINAADITSAEKAIGEARNVHDELLKHLDPINNDHALAFSEVYGTRCEVAFSFIASMDLPSLDLDKWKKRLENSKNDIELLKQFINKVPKGPIQNLLSQFPILFSAFEQLHQSLEIVTLKRRPFKKEEIKNLVNVDETLFRARQVILKCGERGRGLLFIIDQLTRLQQNMLRYGEAATQDFGRFSGIVSFVSLVILILILYVTVKPSGYTGVLYYFGALIISLITGFGFGALRFKPLLKIFSDAIKKKRDD